MSQLYIGLMSGTSMDGVDAVLVDLQTMPHLIAAHQHPIPSDLVAQLMRLNQPNENEIDIMGQTDVRLGQTFADAANALLKKTHYTAKDIVAIGSHGQNIRHRPNVQYPFTLQIADPNVIAAKTNITTIADFRRKDIALGGGGAPLTPAFHHAFMSGKHARVILNIGGIANITLLDGDNISGFDTGPGNCLIDNWFRQHQDGHYDLNGLWAAQGNVINDLLEQLLQDNYFIQSPPKCTGTEYFNLSWLQVFLKPEFNAEDVQATLVELTAQTIIDAIAESGFAESDIFVCGGGVHNEFLMQRLTALHNSNVASTITIGIEPDWVEATAFAWFAKNTLERKPSNLPQVTGSQCKAILGGIYYP